MQFDGRHLMLVFAALAVGYIAGAIYGWLLKGEKNEKR